MDRLWLAAIGEAGLGEAEAGPGGGLRKEVGLGRKLGKGRLLES